MGTTGVIKAGSASSNTGGEGQAAITAYENSEIFVEGTIKGGNAIPGSYSEYGGAGIEFSGGGKITLEGGVVEGGSGAGTSEGGRAISISNASISLDAASKVSGGLNGNGVGRAAAIYMYGLSNTLDLKGDINASQSYAKIEGTVQGATYDQAVDTLKLTGTGGIFDLANIGPAAQFRNFDVIDIAAGNWTMSGTSTADAATNVAAASGLSLGGALGPASIGGNLSVKGFGSLDNVSSDNSGNPVSGAATIRGSLTIEAKGNLNVHALTSGTTALAIEKSFSLSPTSAFGVWLRAPSATPLITVGDDVALNGSVHVYNDGGMSTGTYRLLGYDAGATVSGSGLTLGDTPSVAWSYALDQGSGYLDLIVSSGASFWNGTTSAPGGTVAGGDGIWVAGGTNWTSSDGSAQLTASVSAPAVFSGHAGEVTVDTSAGAVGATGLSFQTSGYSLVGGVLTLANGTATPRVEVGGTATSATIATTLAGTHGLEKIGTGTLILTGENTYTGGTTVSAGTLQIGDGGTTGSVTGDIVNNATLVFARSDAYDFPGTISGTGAVVLKGGTVNFTGASGYSGEIAVQDSVLTLSRGSTSTAKFAVGNGGTIAGTGTIGGLIVRSGGRASPGYSPGTISVNGDVTFDAGSIYVAELRGADHDLIAATGTATIHGGTVQAVGLLTSPVVNQPYRILSADGGVTGQFTTVTSNYAFVTPSLSYDANAVYLTLLQDVAGENLPSGAVFSKVGITPNQIATSGALEQLGVSNPIVSALTLQSADTARAAYDALSGEVHASARTMLLEDSHFVRDATGQRLRADALDLQASGWVQTYGSTSSRGGDGNAAGFDRDIGGLLVGSDGFVADAYRLGVVGSYGHSSLKLDAGRGTTSVDTFGFGVYGGREWGALGVSAGVNVAWHALSSERSVAFPGYTDSLTADHDARTVQAYGEVGYEISLGQATVEPFAGLAQVWLHTSGFQEQGQAAALTVNGVDTDVSFSTIGVRARTQFTLGGMAFQANGMAGWRHALNDVTPTSLGSFAGGQAFGVQGLPVAQDVGIVEAGVSAKLNRRTTLGLSYTGQFGSGVSDHGVRANLSIAFD
ncbi:autotransporter outer membrane beta-barrel domain-containing protein [Aureimonas frigidaquae]|uniref:Outer membrane autotransporter barrel n=1 Tax=Aureimonas frigidaquae TaxID=424757 RepID=A0A0P0Z3X9_9HYPH|nr:autotransporter domain-containing protein [Aureimonas frigidaquae]BAT28742.1 outer membrane autotransporter barrel [Aureimonas frigidaquae]